MTLVAFPAGMYSSVQMESEALEQLAPDVAVYIDSVDRDDDTQELQDVQRLQGLLDFYDIPADLQPEAARQLAFGFGLSDPPNWRYDSARVERVADQLVRRTPDQLAARAEVLAQFALLNGSEPADAFEAKELQRILPRLAHEDRRRAVKLMSGVMVEQDDAQLVRAAVTAFAHYLFYLQPMDDLEALRNLFTIFSYRRVGAAESDEIAIFAEARRALIALCIRLARHLSPPEFLRIAEEAHRLSERFDPASAGFDAIAPVIGVVTAILSCRDEGRTPFAQAQSDADAILARAMQAAASTASGSNAAEGAAFSRLRENLREIGFQRIGDSPYFVRDAFVVRVAHDGRPTVFARTALGERVEAVISGDDDIQLLCRGAMQMEGGSWISVHRLRSLLHGAQPAFPLELAKEARAKAASLEEQLVDAGFQEDPSAKGIFRKEIFRTGVRKEEAIVCVHEGEAWFAGLSLKGRDRGMFSSDARFHDMGDPNALKLQRGTVEAIIDQRYGATLVWLTGPLETIPEELVDVMEAFDDRDTGFVFGGFNPTEAILGLTLLNGISIAELEETMRPGNMTPWGSNHGLLGRDESLLGSMAEDNEWVVEHKLSHRELGALLKRAHWAISNLQLQDLRPAFEQRMQRDPEFRQKYGGPLRGLKKPYLRAYCDELGLGGLYRDRLDNGRYNGFAHVQEFEFRGQRFFSLALRIAGVQRSPFRDGLQDSTGCLLVNIDTGACLEYAGLMPDLIVRYGFYGGSGSPYRVSPEEIAKLFGLIT